MSVSNDNIETKSKNYFNTVTPFPLPIDGKLDTLQFLNASRGIVSLIEMFGHVFSAVKFDMNRNIKKLTTEYEQDTEKHKYLHDMIMNTENSDYTADALLWLKRALHLFLKFFELVLSTRCLHNQGGEYEVNNLSELLKVAYEETLSSNHGWLEQKLFQILSQKCPNRTKLIQIISLDSSHTSEDIIYKDMADFIFTLKINVDNLSEFYRENNLDPDIKV